MSRERAQALLADRFGIVFPYHKMGKIDSLDLFGSTELMILAMYEANRGRWHRVLDIGANIGLHSIMLDMCDFEVHAYEPDPAHFATLLENLDNNASDRVRPFNVAVHTFDGAAPFVRVLDNLTGNHLKGYKNSYGPVEDVTVPVIDCRKLWPWADFAKIDSEGNEADLCRTMTAEDMKHLQVVLEVRNYENAQAIFEHFHTNGVPMWSQKRDWARVVDMGDMPHKNREGSLFVGHVGPWGRK